ncbi:NAD(P)-dependent oxidoreductase [Hamadaea tsunoensis]|uniref:NAD(P)-dependent oxidoreductase n=1 Tax=Hamadaea tsunoensis TaxID=53368 RepID=UPI000409A85C|nr:SDR family oxidoreductase [Hamadaea tsunoensis]
MRIVIFGAHGLTGRTLTGQALAAGHEVTAITRRPAEFPVEHARLRVVGADVYDGNAVDAATAGAEAVLSTLGVPFTRKPVSVYSEGIRNITAAMARHGVSRIVAVSSSATYPHHHADGGFLMNRVLQPIVVATIGRSTYADMRIMEEHLRGSGLRWTIVRPSGLFDTPEVSRYRLHENEAPGIFTSRADLAASLLEQLADDRYLRKAVAVTTVEGTPTLWQMMRNEAVKQPGGPRPDRSRTPR